ncbi:MAG: phosphate signaling complex protein PhoU [Thermoprotei archaeon]
MVRLIELGLERLNNMLSEMASLSEKTVNLSLEAFMSGVDVKEEVLKRAQQLKQMKEEIGELVVEIIARYQPAASDLRFIKSALEISYDFYRFGRYSYDIAVILGDVGAISECDKEIIKNASKIVITMMRDAIKAFILRNVELTHLIYEKDDEIDKIYEEAFKKAIHTNNPLCDITSLLILRYLERIADHATYIADSLVYIVKGT